jgi:Tfp pilus assembly protein PilZ
VSDPADRRQTERVATRTLVEVRIPTWEALRSVYTANLSLGGVRLSLPGGARVPLGAAVDMILTLPNGERLHLPGKVAHIDAAGGDMGVRFEELNGHTRDELVRHLDDLKRGNPHAAKNAAIPPGTLIKKTT